MDGKCEENDEKNDEKVKKSEKKWKKVEKNKKMKIKKTLDFGVPEVRTGRRHRSEVVNRNIDFFFKKAPSYRAL